MFHTTKVLLQYGVEAKQFLLNYLLWLLLLFNCVDGAADYFLQLNKKKSTNSGVLCIMTVVEITKGTKSYLSSKLLWWACLNFVGSSNNIHRLTSCGYCLTLLNKRIRQDLKHTGKCWGQLVCKFSQGHGFRAEQRQQQVQTPTQTQRVNHVSEWPHRLLKSKLNFVTALEFSHCFKAVMLLFCWQLAGENSGAFSS